MAKVSIVIPVYNVARYLRECLDSVINQTLKDIEIIIVDDGSMDGSTDICRYYADHDPRIKLLVQENQGVASARKNGIALASAQYVGFVDADDYVDLDMYEALLKHISGCDMVSSGAYTAVGERYDAIPCGVYQTATEMDYIFDNMILTEADGKRGIYASLWNKLFRTDYAKKTFQEIDVNIYYGEDGDFVFRYILKCKGIRITNLCKYHYRWREDSAVHSADNGYLKNMSDLYQSLSHAFKAHSHNEQLTEQLQRFMLRLIQSAPRNMGFSLNARLIEYISPFLNTFVGHRVALYGAGAVGQNYYVQMMKLKGNEPVLWVDKQYEHYQKYFRVRPVEDLAYGGYDYIVIAVEREGAAQSIKEELLARGIAEEKILWKAPISTLM